MSPIPSAQQTVCQTQTSFRAYNERLNRRRTEAGDALTAFMTASTKMVDFTRSKLEPGRGGHLS
jgi:hypothetical protein